MTRPGGMTVSGDLFQQGRLPVDALNSRTIKLDEINEAFDALAEGSVVRQIIAFYRVARVRSALRSASG
jgi:threonine dehydrogenase-like Zn-dependent dehydrogenase